MIYWLDIYPLVFSLVTFIEDQAIYQAYDGFVKECTCQVSSCLLAGMLMKRLTVNEFQRYARPHKPFPLLST